MSESKHSSKGSIPSPALSTTSIALTESSSSRVISKSKDSARPVHIDRRSQPGSHSPLQNSTASSRRPPPFPGQKAVVSEVRLNNVRAGPAASIRNSTASPGRRPPLIPRQKPATNASGTRYEPAGTASSKNPTTSSPRPPPSTDQQNGATIPSVKASPVSSSRRSLRSLPTVSSSGLPVPSKITVSSGLSPAALLSAVDDDRLQKLLQENEEQGSQIHDLRRQVEEQGAKLAVAEGRIQTCEQAEGKAKADNSELRANLQRSERTNSDLRQVKDQLSADLIHYRGQADKLESQATLAGELQTEVNILKNVQFPRLQQENAELQQMIKQLESGSTLNEEEREELEGLREENDLLRDHIQAERNVAHANDEYIAKQDDTIETLHEMYAVAVKDVNGKDICIAQVKTKNEVLEAQNEQFKQRCRALEDRIRVDKAQFDAEYDDLEAQKQAAGAEAQAKINSLSEQVIKLTTAVAPQLINLTPINTVFQTEPIPEKPTPIYSSSSIGTQATTTTQEITGMQTLSLTTPPKANTPAPPLDKDLAIIINLDPTSRAKFTFLQHLSSITTPNTSLHINGPAHIVQALTLGMQTARAEAEHNKTRVLELKQMLWDNLRYTEKLKRNGCGVAAHVKMADDLAAKQEQIDMQDIILTDNRRELARLAGSRVDGIQAGMS
ncbi:hypothetical protein N0V90_003555 [Kalmusia sp. IMI 367209]|nr:hypothetical protein N0V90_003555 [Kalmusia sp. IMI 367209]